MQVNFKIKLNISREMYDWIFAMPCNQLKLPIMNYYIEAHGGNHNYPIRTDYSCICIYENAIEQKCGLDDIIFGSSYINTIQQLALAFQEATMLYTSNKAESGMTELKKKYDSLSAEIAEIKNENVELMGENIGLKVKIANREDVIAGFKSIKTQLDSLKIE